MTDEPKHIKLTEHTIKEDGTHELIARSYYDKLANESVTHTKNMYTSRGTILRDIMSCLDLVTQEGSPEVDIKIISKQGEPRLIVKSWVVYRKDLGKR